MYVENTCVAQQSRDYAAGYRDGIETVLRLATEAMALPMAIPDCTDAAAAYARRGPTNRRQTGPKVGFLTNLIYTLVKDCPHGISACDIKAAIRQGPSQYAKDEYLGKRVDTYLTRLRCRWHLIEKYGQKWYRVG